MNTWILRMKGSERERERVTGTNLSSWLLPSSVPLPPWWHLTIQLATKVEQKNWLFILESIKFNWWPPRFTPSTRRTSDFIASNFPRCKSKRSEANKTPSFLQKQNKTTPVDSGGANSWCPHANSWLKTLAQCWKRTWLLHQISLFQHPKNLKPHQNQQNTRLKILGINFEHTTILGGGN